ncbi:MAG: hypothetical protein ACFFG0_07160 [Candidatus Thorarchaeota archaeon]
MYWKTNRVGTNTLHTIIKYQKQLTNLYEAQLDSDLNDIDFLLKNKRLFIFQLTELIIAALKYDLEDKTNFFRKDKGWFPKRYKSTRKALDRYLILYMKVYEGPFIFLITYLITLLLIKRDYFFKIQESLLKRKPLYINQEMASIIGEKILPVLIKGDYYIEKTEDEKTRFSIEKLRDNKIKIQNLEKYRYKTIKYLREIPLDNELIQIFERFTPCALWEIKIYKELFKNVYGDFKIANKLNFLEYLKYNIKDWIIPLYRHASAHPLKWIYNKTEDNEAAIKIIMGGNAGEIIDVNKFWGYLCRLYALKNLLYLKLINRYKEIEGRNGKLYQISTKRLNKNMKRIKRLMP